MGDSDRTNQQVERRSESRQKAGKFFCVEFSVSGISSIYKYKIWDMSSKGMCILVKESSVVMNRIKVGDQLDMKYYSEESGAPAQALKTEIKYISPDELGRFKGHYLVGLEILEKKEVTMI